MESIYKIPFNRPSVSKKYMSSLERCITSRKYEGGDSTKNVLDLLTKITGSEKILLTHSCTAALEMSALLIGIQPGDEIIMPSYTFVSTANAFILRGGKPVFIDLNPATLNLDDSLIEAAITNKTKAIVPVHYSGVSCNLDQVLKIAKKYNLFVIEDAAQGIGATYKQKHLGTFGALGTFSFHYTKNVSAGFGGALLINDADLFAQSKVIHQRGTNREAFLEGQVDKYTWIDMGSSFVMGELSAAVLLPQLQDLSSINNNRLIIYNRYYSAFQKLEELSIAKCPSVRSDSVHNAHIFYLVLGEGISRADFMSHMASKGVQVTSHYQPLHQSGYYKQKYGESTLPHTERIASQIVRFPLYEDLTIEEQNYVIDQAQEFFSQALQKIV